MPKVHILRPHGNIYCGKQSEATNTVDSALVNRSKERIYCKQCFTRWDDVDKRERGVK